MKLDIFKGQVIDELSMIEVARAILEEKGDKMPFADIVNEIQNFLGKSDEEIRDRLPQFYTDLNIDGSFISLGDNVWGLRSWYPYDSVDEEVNHPEDEDEGSSRRRKPKKVNAFLVDTDDDDIIDYDADDPEDDDLDVDTDSDDYDSNSDDDDDSDNLQDGIEGDLSDLPINGDDDDDDDE